ncbi:hypothetical protein Hamer_G022698 [Homarus americanus]|uniref:Uncharacterized protein n=1 Tax=Homarus americanus TaxID=6706 RepID=A0A8J5JP86_HOMAM|nr:hypothetical protein Hamer_G030915 [Homarus americanus]KAG7165780.1 hypothetical protein Hamer_G022698 [Homarus americanus]
MEQEVSSPTKSVKMEAGVSQSEQRDEPTDKEESVDLFPQLVAHGLKLRTFSGTPDNLDQINKGEWVAEAKCNIRLFGYKGSGADNYILKFLTGPAQKRLEKLAWSDSCNSEGIFSFKGYLWRKPGTGGAPTESAMYVDSGGTGRPPVGTGTKVEGKEAHQGGTLSSLEVE